VEDDGFFLYNSSGTAVGQFDFSGAGGNIQINNTSSGGMFAVNVSGSPSRIIIDGTSGFTGTVSPVSSITVKGGVVTSVT
jgi:hypothetical protein